MLMPLLQSLDSLTDTFLKSEQPKTRGDKTKKEIKEHRDRIRDLERSKIDYTIKIQTLEGSIPILLRNLEYERTRQLPETDKKYRHLDVNKVADQINQTRQQIIDYEMRIFRNAETIRHLESDIQELNRTLYKLGIRPEND